MCPFFADGFSACQQAKRPEMPSPSDAGVQLREDTLAPLQYMHVPNHTTQSHVC